jgi:hypothetical protein
MGMSPRLLRPRATGFNPKSISGLAFWLDAADASTVTLVSGNVSAWASKSGSASPRTFTQTTANNRPTTTTVNGKAAILFNGTTTSLGNTTADNVENRTWFVVAVRGDVSTRQCVVASSYEGLTLYGSWNSIGFSATNGYPNWNSRQNSSPSASYRAVSTTASTSVPTVFRYQYIQSEINAQNYINIVRRANGSADNANGNGIENYTAGIYLGAVNQVPASGQYAFFLSGSICEILAYDAFLTSTQCTSVENYLKSKWGVSY